MMINYDDRVTRLNKRFKGISRVLTAIDDLYLYGVFVQNYPNLSVVLEEAKSHLKKIQKDTKQEIAVTLEPTAKYDLTEKDKLEVIEDE